MIHDARALSRFRSMVAMLRFAQNAASLGDVADMARCLRYASQDAEDFVDTIGNDRARRRRYGKAAKKLIGTR